MPRITRSSEVLHLIEGLFYIEDDVIELAAKFYSELRCVAATYGEEAVVKLIPLVTELMSKLNEMSKNNAELKQDIVTLQEDLSQAENMCLNLNNSMKDKASECVEQEHRYDEEIMTLSTQLKQTKEDNGKLRVALKECKNMDFEQLQKDNDKKLAALQAERKCMLTTIEVMEEELRALRGEIANYVARQAKSTVEADLLTELTLAAANNVFSSTNKEPDITDTSCQKSQLPSVNPSPPYASRSEMNDSSTSQQDLSKVLIIGDSHLRYTTDNVKKRGGYVECCPGGKINDIKRFLLDYLDVELDLIYFNIGTNNLKRNYRGGQGYNGGHGKRAVLHAMADLLYTAKTQFKNSKIILNSILIRRDIGYRALHDFNDQLELMCNNFDVTFVEANCCVGRRDLARDGVHFNRRGVARLSKLFVDVVSHVLWSTEAAPASTFYDQGEIPSPVPPPVSHCSTETERAADSSFYHGDSSHCVSGGMPQNSGN